MVRSFFPGSLIAATALVLATPVLADVKAGVDAWSRGDYAAAIAEWKEPAARGDADAEFNLGQAYKLGRGVPQDLAKAEEFFAKASAQGHLQASDNYGLLLHERGERAKAMPYISAAAARGDARAQYLLGVAHFNGENVPKDWVRAYALVSLAQQAGLPQAVPTLAQMDEHIPLPQRQQSVRLATQLAADATATRARQVAAADLRASVPGASISEVAMGRPALAGKSPRLAAAERSDTIQARPRSPLGKVPPVADLLAQAPARPAFVLPRPTASVPAPPLPVAKVPAPKPPAATAAPRASGGPWRVQLGAFGVPGNAEALWNRVRNRPELAGTTKLLVPAGQLRKLQAGGFASSAEAQAACRRLSAAGYACLPVRN